MPAGPREVALGPKTADELGLGDRRPHPARRPERGRRRARSVVVGEVLMPDLRRQPVQRGHGARHRTPSTRSPRATASTQRSSPSTTASTRTRRPAACAPCCPTRSPCTRTPRRRPTSPTSTACSSFPACSACSSASSPWPRSATRSATSVRRRRHDLGIVRSLGFVARDVRPDAHRAVVDARRRRSRRRHPARHRGRPDWRGSVVAERHRRARRGQHVAARARGRRARLGAGRRRCCRCCPGLAAARQRAVDALRVE